MTLTTMILIALCVPLGVTMITKLRERTDHGGVILCALMGIATVMGVGVVFLSRTIETFIL